MFCLYKLAFVLLLLNVSICENWISYVKMEDIMIFLIQIEGFFFNLTTFHLVAWFSGKN